MKENSQNYPQPGLSAPVRRFDRTFLIFVRFRRTQGLTRSIDGLRGRSFLSSYCFPQLANPSSVVDLGSSLTIKARTVTILSGHTILFQPAHAGRRYNLEDSPWKYSTATRKTVQE
jgi:hypothetical protein